jgi:hypothetical protein
MSSPPRPSDGRAGSLNLSGPFSYPSQAHDDDDNNRDGGDDNNRDGGG